MGLLLHTDLVVRDAERSLAFYVGLLGAVVAEDAIVEGAPARFYGGPEATSMRLVMLRFTEREPDFGAMLELIEPRPPVEAAPRRGGIRNLALLVSDLDETLRRLAEAEVRPVTGIWDMALPRLGKSRTVFLEDPDGNLIELVQRVEDEG